MLRKGRGKVNFKPDRSGFSGLLSGMFASIQENSTITQPLQIFWKILGNSDKGRSVTIGAWQSVRCCVAEAGRVGRARGI